MTSLPLRLICLLTCWIVCVAAAPALGVVRGDDYPVQWRDAPMGSVRDDWGGENRVCYSFVLWRLLQDGHDLRGLDATPSAFAVAPGLALDVAIANARQRDGYVITVGATPSVGAIATWTGAELGTPEAIGHVAYVAEVHGDLVTIEEYNRGGRGTYGTDVIPAASVPRYLSIRRLRPDEPREVPTPPPARSSVAYVGAGSGNVSMRVALADRSRVHVTVARAGRTVRFSRVMDAVSGRRIYVNTTRLRKGRATVTVVVTPVDPASARDPDGVRLRRTLRLVYHPL